MNGTKLLVDTNIALYLLGGDSVVATLLEGREVYISVITEMEMLAYPGISDSEIAKVKAFIADCQVVDMASGIKDKAIELRRRHNLKLPDAIIAATALHLNIPLISADAVFFRLKEINFVHYSF